SRVPKIAPYIDRVEPIRSAGVDLVRRLGGTVRGPFIPSDDGTPEALANLWREFANGSVDHAAILKAAADIELDSQRRAADWLATVEAAGKVAEWDDSTLSEQDVARKVAHHFFEQFGRDMSVPGGMHERFEGYYRCAGLHAARSRRRATGQLPKADENDAEDL